MDKAKILEAIKKLKENEERKFDESIDLIINLKNFEVKRDNVNVIVHLPHAIRKANVFGFLTKKTPLINSISKEEFDRYSEKNKIRKLIHSYDYFIGVASLMPLIASKFGKYLGIAGKMPSPQLGVLMNENDDEIKKILPLFDKVVRVKAKEPSLKFVVAKKSMKDEDSAENIAYAFNAILNALPRKEQQIKNVMIKLTMSKPIKID